MPRIRDSPFAPIRPAVASDLATHHGATTEDNSAGVNPNPGKEFVNIASEIRPNNIETRL
jgi:hypothetical protein